MDKQTFIKRLTNLLNGKISANELVKWVMYYEEIIDDRVEEGQTEQQVISELGELPEIVDSILEENGKQKERRKIGAWVYIALILGFPVWGSLFITLLILVLVAYILIWVFVVSICAVTLSVGVVGIVGIIGAVPVMTGGIGVGIVQLGAGCFCIGLCMLMVLLCAYSIKWSTQLTILISKKLSFVVTKLVRGGHHEII